MIRQVKRKEVVNMINLVNFLKIRIEFGIGIPSKLRSIYVNPFHRKNIELAKQFVFNLAGETNIYLYISI
jgi:hypothetical protein